jgi:hypothetical protein
VGGRRAWALTSAGVAYWSETTGWRSVAGMARSDVHAIAASDQEEYPWIGYSGGFGYLHVPEPLPAPPGNGPQPPKATRQGRHVTPVLWADAHDDPVLCEAYALAGPDPLGRIWAGTGDGVAILDGGGGREAVRFEFADEIAGIAGPGANGAMWLLALSDGPIIADANATGDRDDPIAQRLVPGCPGVPLHLSRSGDGPGFAGGQGVWTPVPRPGGGIDWRRAAPPLPGDSYPIAVAGAPGGVWWAATVHGLYRFEGGAWQPKRLPNEEPFRGVRCLLAAGGVCWIGASSGLWSWSGGLLLHRPLPPGAAGQGVQALAEGASGLWVALDDGVILYDQQMPAAPPRRRFTPTDSGLASGTIHAMLEANGVLWLATAGGISRFEQAE